MNELILKKPIQSGSETISKLVFVEPKAKHMRSMPPNPTVSDLLDLAGRLSGQPKHVIDELSIVDMNEVMAVISGFLDGSPQTGSGH